MQIYTDSIFRLDTERQNGNKKTNEYIQKGKISAE